MASKWGKKKKETVDSHVAVGANPPERISNRLERKIVVENKPEKRSARLVKFTKMHLRLVLPIALLFILGAVVFAVQYIGTDDTPVVHVPKNCREALGIQEWQKVVDALSKPEGEKMQNAKASLEKNCPSYADDNDYKYLSTIYYISLSDYGNARKSLEQLPEERSNGNYRLANHLTLESDEQLKSRIILLEKTVKNNIQTDKIIPGPGE